MDVKTKKLKQGMLARLNKLNFLSCLIIVSFFDTCYISFFFLAHLSFGQKEKVVENKENIPLPTEKNNSEIVDGILFKSTQKQRHINEKR